MKIISNNINAPLLYKQNIKTGFSNLRTNIRTLLSRTSSTFPILVTGMCVGKFYYNNHLISSIPDANRTPIRMNTYLSTTCVPYINSNISNVKYVPTNALTTDPFTNVLQCDSTINSNGTVINQNGGPNHFSATSQRELGKRFYSYYSTM